MGKDHVGLTSEEMLEFVTELDTDCSGVVDYSEFVAAALSTRLHYEEDACWAAFRIFDRDGDGKITLAELTQVLSEGRLDKTIGQEAAAHVMKDGDINSDGEIDFQEFMHMMRGAGEQAVV